MLKKLWEEILNNKDNFQHRYTQKLSELATKHSYYVNGTVEVIDVITVKEKPISIEVRKEKDLFP